MPNINIEKRLDKICDELAKVLEHVAQYSGIPNANATRIDNRCCDIAELASRIGAYARERQGNRSSETLVRDVRKALGYTIP
jgi:hypothetical protein